MRRLVLTILLPVVAGCFGYCLGAMRERAIVQLPRNAAVELAQLLSAESFSEVEQTRATLDALADRYAVFAQQLIVEDVLEYRDGAGNRAAGEMPPLAMAIRVLEEAISEFRGTGHEMRLLPPLLNALKRAGRHDQWLDVYLGALYEQPTHMVVGNLAEQAVAIGEAVGREDEVAAALRHLQGVPLASGARWQIERCLARVGADLCGAAQYHEAIH